MAAIEFQVGVAAFLQAQKTVLQAQQLCPPAPISVGPVQVVIDRFEFDNGTFRHNVPVSYTIFYRQPGQTVDSSTISVPGFQTQIAQPVTVYVAAFNDLVAHPNGLPDVIVPLPFTIVINVDFYAVNQVCYLALSFATLEVGPLPTLPPNFDPLQIPLPITASSIATALNAALTALIPDRVFPIDPLSLLRTVDVAPDPTQIVNAGVSVDSQLQRLALHIEIGAPAENPDLPWLNFFQGIFPDRLQGAEHRLYLTDSYRPSGGRFAAGSAEPVRDLHILERHWQRGDFEQYPRDLPSARPVWRPRAESGHSCHIFRSGAVGAGG